MWSSCQERPGFKSSLPSVQSHHHMSLEELVPAPTACLLGYMQLKPSGEYQKDTILLLLCQDALAVDAFSTSEQAFGAEKLLEAYRSGDPEAVRKSIASQSLFLDLDNQVRSHMHPYMIHDPEESRVWQLLQVSEPRGGIFPMPCKSVHRDSLPVVPGSKRDSPSAVPETVTIMARFEEMGISSKFFWQCTACQPFEWKTTQARPYRRVSTTSTSSVFGRSCCITTMKRCVRKTSPVLRARL